MISLMLHEIRVRRKMIFWWAVGLSAFGIMYLGFYPSITEEFRDLDIESIDLYKAMGVSGMSTFEDYATSTVLNILPLLVGAFGIVLGTGALAGEEGAGTLELLATLPISRFRLYVAKTASILIASLVSVLIVAALVTGLFLLIESDVETSVSALDLFWALLSLWLIAFVFMSLGLFLGAFLPSRGSAAAIAAAVLVITFFANNLAELVEALERFQPLFPSYYYMGVAEMLTGDVPWDDVGMLLLMGLVPLVLGVLAFRRRNLMVGAWPWQRARPGAAAPVTAAAGLGAGVTGAAAAGGAVDGVGLGTTAGAAGGPAPMRSWRSRRVLVPLAVAALAVCGCVAVSAAALTASDDIRADVEDLFDFGDVVTGTGKLEVADVDADDVEVGASATGRVVSVPVSVDDQVDEGDVLLVLVNDTESAHGPDAQRVLEDAWVLLDEIATGETDESADDLKDARSRASDDHVLAKKALRDAEAAGESDQAIEELGIAAELAEAGLRIASVRLALADDDLTEDDVREVEEAMDLAQGNLLGAGIELQPSAMRAPAFGSVTEILVDQDDTVSAGQTVVILTPSDRYEFEFRISEDDADKLTEGQWIEIEIEDYDDPFDGRVLAISDYDKNGDGDGEGDDEDEDEDNEDLKFVVRILVIDPEQLLDEGEKVDARFEVD